jgi:hypothetical protein
MLGSVANAINMPTALAVKLVLIPVDGWITVGFEYISGASKVPADWNKLTALVVKLVLISADNCES